MPLSRGRSSMAPVVGCSRVLRGLTPCNHWHSGEDIDLIDYEDYH